MRIPQIGIPGWSQGENSFGATKAYLHHLSYFGETRILTPKRTIDLDLDLVVLPGGKDTFSYKYGQAPGYYTQDPDQFKEAFMQINVPQYIEAGIPIWGTCLGFQQLIVHFGGKLIQQINISNHGYSDTEHKGRGDLVNDLSFTSKYKLLEDRLLKNHPRIKKIKCCSLHHQGVQFEGKQPNYGLPDCLDAVAYAEDDILECFVHKTLPIAGGQFHVEEDYNLLGHYFLEHLISQSQHIKKEKDAIKTTSFKS